MSFVNRTFICPEPLVYTYNDKDTVLWAYEEGNCASPCPTLTYSHEEWDFLKVVVLILAVASFIATAAAILVLLADFSKLFMRAMFLFGFLVSSVISMAFFIENRHDEIVCNGEGHFVKQNPFCVFHSTTVVFLFLWVESWAVLLAADTYLHIVSKLTADQMAILRKRYVIGTVLFCTCMTSIPLIGGNLGFDPYANLPFCLYLYSDDKWYFWLTLFSPFILLNSVCLIITLAGASRIHRIFVSAKNFSSQHRARSHDTDGTSVTHITTSHSDKKGLHSPSSGSAITRTRACYNDDEDEENDGEGYGYDDSVDTDEAQEYYSHDISSMNGAHLSSKSVISNKARTQPSMDTSAGSSSSIASQSMLRVPLMSRNDQEYISGYENDDVFSDDPATVNPFHSSLPSPSTSLGDDRLPRHKPPLGRIALHGTGMERDSLSDSVGPTRESIRSSWGMPPSEQGDDQTMANTLHAAMPATALAGSMQSASRARTVMSTSLQSGSGLPTEGSGLGKRSGGGGGGRQYSTEDSSVAGTMDRDSTAWRRRVTKTLMRKGTENLALLKESLRYNGRSILFVVVFCLTTMYIAPSLLYINAVKYDYYVDGTEDFAACLVQASFAAPQQTQHEVNKYAQSICGKTPSVRPGKWQVQKQTHYVMCAGGVCVSLYRCVQMLHAGLSSSLSC